MNNSLTQTYLLLTERFKFNNKSKLIQYFNHLKCQEIKRTMTNMKRILKNGDMKFLN